MTYFQTIEKKGRFRPSGTSAQHLNLASAPYTILNDEREPIIGLGVNQDFQFRVKIGPGCGFWIFSTGGEQGSFAEYSVTRFTGRIP
jgi:hypothetical protein